MAKEPGKNAAGWGRTLSGVDALVVLTDASGVILTANATATALSAGGRPLVGRPFVRGGWFTQMPASAARADTMLMQARDGRPVRREVDVRLANGERQPYEFTVMPEVDEAGAVTRMLITGMHVSISADTDSSHATAFQDRLDEALRTLTVPQRILDVSTRMLAEFLGASRVAYAEVDESAGTYEVCHEHRDGSPSGLGIHGFDLHDADVVARIRRGEPLVLRDTRGDGATPTLLRSMDVAATICVPLLKANHVVGLMAVHQDAPRDWTVSEIALIRRVAERCWSTLDRVRVSHRLAQSERQFQELFEYAPDATLLVDAQGKIVLANRGAEVLFGYASGVLIGQPIEVLVPETHRGGHGKLREKYSSEGVRRIMSRRPGLQARRKDGSHFLVEVSLNPIETENGPMVAASVRDLTDRERMERQLQKASQMETIGQLAGGVAHDFNNLLTVINATTELLQYQAAAPAPLDPAMLRADLQTIITAGQKAAALTQQLLALSQQQVLRPVIVDLNRKLEQIEPILRRAIGEQVFLRIVPSDRILPVLVDRVQIDQVLLNLALNGRDAMPDGGVLSITLGAREDHDNDWITVAVRDTGDGMDAATRQRIFEPFFTTKGRGRGTGLGLSTASGIIEQSGGRIEVDSALGEGTTFTICLPRAATDAHQTAPPRNTPVPTGETVLVVDDEDAVRGVTRMMLEIQGFTVISLDSGDAALTFFEHRISIGQPIDLVLMDVLMPGSSGPDTAARMWAIQPDLPVVFMSGHTADLLPRESEVRTRHFLGKPFTLEQLGDTIRGAIGARPS